MKVQEFFLFLRSGFPQLFFLGPTQALLTHSSHLDATVILMPKKVPIPVAKYQTPSILLDL